MNRTRAILGLVVLALCACKQEAPALRDATPVILSVGTGGGVFVEVVNWGGSGRPLVFLAGGGHTAHEFDDFAPLLTSDFRVLGITRRGIGASSDVAPESMQDHVHDVLAVLDTLGLASAVLVGHSFAGMEMALLAEEHGGRCAGLVYLDSAYDYTDPALGQLFEKTPPPQAPPMQAADSASVDAVRAYTQRTQGMSIPETEIRARWRLDATGRLVERAPNKSTRLPPRAPRWGEITCPSLGIYAVPAPLETWLPYYETMDLVARERGQGYYEAFADWTAAHRQRFGQFPQNEVVEFPSSNHYFFLEKPDDAAGVIREWSRALP